MRQKKGDNKPVITELQEHLDLMQHVRNDDALVSKIVECCEEITRCFRSGGKVLIFGCGGSAADSQHIAAEFINKLNFVRESLPAIALTTDTSVLTAIGNDSSFDLIFSRQIDALAKEGDIVIGISTSGTSPSVIHGLRSAKKNKAKTLFLTGEAVQDQPDSDYVITIPSQVTTRIQEAHITIAHIICCLVERELFERKH
jgi:D-sedoheptulose 7-phosphate isomerase